MARKTVQPIAIELGIKGGEKLAALNRSFRDLSKQVKLSDADIAKATKDIIDFAKKVGDSEATIRGQIKAFEGLREQAAMGGKAYVQLGRDIANLKSNLQGSTSAIDAKKKAILDLADSTGATSRQVQRAIDKLSALRAETKLDSTAFTAFGKDIEGLVAKLNLLDQQAEKAAKKAGLLAGGIRATPGAIRAQAQAFKEQAASVQLQIDSIDGLTKKERTLKKNVEERLALQEKLNKLLRSEAQAGFLASVESGRKVVISAADAFNDADVGINSFNKRLQLLDDTFGKLPNTTAGFNQRLQELQKQLVNTIRDGGNYVSVALEIARVQREAAAATQGLGAALVNDLASGVAVRSQRNLREAIGQLQAEMLELNTTTAEGSAKYAQNAAQVNRLQKELDQITNSYRTVGDAARQANAAMGGGGINPFGAAGGRNPAYSRAREKQEMEQIAQLQQELNVLEGEYADSLRSALQTMQEYEQKRHDDFMRQVDERQAAEDKASAQAIENIKREGQAERDQFNTLLQQQKAAASAMGIGGRTDISSLYEGIIGLSTADIRRQQQMMGKSATEVFNDIATSFKKGGQAVDLKAKSTDIGGSIAEGVVNGASDSDEIKSGAKTFAQRLIAAYKAAFGIRSPSKETEQKIGIPLGLGIIRGLLSALRSGKKEVQQEIESIAKPLIPKSRQPRRLIGTVNEDIATFTGYGTRPRPAMPGYRPLPKAAQDLETEIGRMFNRFKNDIAGLTTDPKIYYNLVQSLPTSKITTDLAAMASRRARLYEIPGFMETQRQIGPGDLEREIASSVAGYMRELRTPNPWVGPIGDYQKFIDSVSKKTEELIRLREYLEKFTLSDQKLLAGTRIAGALPPSRIGFAADESRLASVLGLGTTKALPPARRRLGELERPDIAMFEPEGTAREYQKMARLLAEASSDLAAAKRFINDVGFQNLPVDVTGLSGAALTNALMGYSRQKRGMSGGGYPELRGIFPGADMGFRGGVAPGRFSFGGQEVLPPSKPQLALPSAEMREFARDIEFEFRKLRAKIRGGSEGEHFMETGRGGGRYQGGFLGGGGGGGGGRGGTAAAGDAGGAFNKLNQTLKEFGPLSDRSVADIRELGASLGSLQDIISPLDADFEQVNKAIAKQSRLIDRELQKRERQRNRRRMSSMQMTQAAGAAISGGIFGGPEGFLGGVGGALVGGVGGAFAGAAAGAQVGMIRQQIGQYTEMAAEIDRLRLGLAGASNDFNEFVQATQATEQASQRLLIPLADSYRIMTQLRANTVELGISVEDTRKIFEGITASVYKTGGGLAEVQGAMRAVIQVLSKGSPQAEELRGQLGERLPAAIVDFAKFTKRTPEELADAFQQSKVTLQEFVDFAKNKFDENGEYLDELASNAAYAGLRYNKALERIQLTTGRAFQASGAALQDFASRWINKIDQIINKAMELRLIDVGPAYFTQQLLNGERTVDQLETELLEKSAKLAEMRKTFFVDAAFVAMGGDRLQNEVNALEQALKQQRAFEKQTKERQKQLEEDRVTEEQKQRGQSLLNAIEQRENAIAQARIQLEEQAANIRKQAIEQAKQLEESIAKQRLDKERQIEDLRRQLAYIEEDIALGAEEARFVAGGGDPEVFRVRREIIEFARQQKEEEISLDRQLLDEQTETQKAIEEFKSNNAKAIMEANTAHAKQIGRIQQEYARSVAKIVEDGTERAGKRLEVAGIIVAQEIKKAEAQATALTLGFSFSGEGVSGPLEALPRDSVEYSQLEAAYKAFTDAQKAIDKANESLSGIPTATAIAAPAVDSISMSFDDLNSRLAASASGLEAVRSQIKGISSDISVAKFSDKLSEAFRQAGAGTYTAQRTMQSEAQRSKNVLRLMEEGYSKDVAERIAEQEARAALEISLYSAIRDQALKELEKSKKSAKEEFSKKQELTEDAQELANLRIAYEETFRVIQEKQDAVKQNFADFSEKLRGSADAVRDLTIALDNIPTEIKLRTAVVDLKQQLKDLVDPANQIKGAATAIGDAFSQSFVDAISGSKTAKEALADFFQSVGSYFLDMAKQIIAKMIQIAILNTFAKVLPSTNLTTSSGVSLSAGAATQSGFDMGSSLASMFANGGIMTEKGPLELNRYASGGIARGPQLAMFGEGRRPEAYVPLPDGRSIPVTMEGGKTSTNVVVNVDAGGTSVQGDDRMGKELGNAISVVVQAELVKHQRPGGLLNR